MSDEVLSVKCPECGQLMTAPSSWAGREISCAACLATVRLSNPPSQELLPPTAPQISETENSTSNNEEPSDTYGLVEPINQDQTKPSRTPSDVDETVETIPLRRPPETTSSESPNSGKHSAPTYELGQVHDVPMVKIEVFEALARVKREPNQKAPTNVFFSNVFEFPWASSDVFFRWLWTSLGYTTGSLLIAVCVTTIQQGGTLGWMLAGFFMLAALACFIWASSYAASCANSILQDTAAGNDRIESWSDEGVVAWIFDFLPIAYVYLVSGTVALLVAMPLKMLFDVLLPIVLLTQLVTFPITWLCALDAQTIWVPFSIAVLRTIPQLPHLWTKFIGLSSTLVLTYFAMHASLVYFQPWIGCLLAGPLLASVLFIYPRLLGRLIWKISETLNREARSRQPTPRAQPTKKQQKQTNRSKK